MIPVGLILAALTGTEAFKSSGAPVAKPYKQHFSDQYSPLKYLGNLGPYSSRRGAGISPAAPEGCEVDQVVLLQRHGERNPDVSDVNAHQALLHKIHAAHPGEFEGDLAFLNGWKYYVDHPGDAGLTVEAGPYSGLADMYVKGTQFLGRYGHLWDRESSLPLFASESERVVQSAREFGRGFLGYNYTDLAELNIISESAYVGGNAISPRFCDLDSECPLPSLSTNISSFGLVFPEFDVAAVRLNEQNGLNLTGTDVGVLFEIGAYEVSVRGSSPWLNVFTREEWLAYAYRRGILFHCLFGTASKHASAKGANWANATTTLLNQGPEDSKLPLALTFGHDSDIVSILGGTGILTPLKPLSFDQVTFDTHWDIDDIVPMGAQLVVERLKCNAPGLSSNTNLIHRNSSLPDSFLGQSYGTPSGGPQTAGYFDPNYANGTTIEKFTVKGNSTKFKNQTIVGPYANSTITVLRESKIHNNGTKNITEPYFVITNRTTRYGLNLTAGTTNGKTSSDSHFVRVILNDAVVPLDFCYDGPGYSCSLEHWTQHIAQKNAENNFEETCHPTQKGVPTGIDFFWNYNRTTSENSAPYVPWQGLTVL